MRVAAGFASGAWSRLSSASRNRGERPTVNGGEIMYRRGGAKMNLSAPRATAVTSRSPFALQITGASSNSRNNGSP